MKDERRMCPPECHHHAHMANWYLLIGAVAFVYGAIMYLKTMYAWPPYTGWMVGGVVLIVLGWLKRMWKMRAM